MPLPPKTAYGLVIYKCNKYPEEYTVKYKHILLYITLGIALSLCASYLLYDVFCEFDIEMEDVNFLDENWNDTQKRPYDPHGLDSEGE